MNDNTTPTGEIAPFVYRNRSDDWRTVDELHFCESCGGYYGVPHTMSHCKKGIPALWGRTQCACRFCRQSLGKPVEGSHGEFLR